MLHVILTILAVIGIIILCILGLILLIALLVLFWPVKYRINASYYDKKYLVKIKVYWLLGLICDRITINNKGFDNTIKVLGFRIGEAKQPKKKKPSETKRPKVQVTEAPEVAKPHDMPEQKKEPEVLKRIRAEKKQEQKSEKKQTKTSKFTRIKEFLKKQLQRFKTITEIIKDKNNKKSFRFIKNQLFYLLKKIRPRKIKADIIFGLGDPALTGQALGGIAVLMGIIGTGFAIQPDFENKIIQGDIEIRGRIFIFTLLLVALRVFRNKGLRRTYKKLKQLDI